MRYITSLRLAVPVAIAILVGGPALAPAHQGATGVVKQRMDFMKDLGSAMKGLGAMLKGEVPYDPDQALRHARTLHEHAPRLVEQFPEGSNRPPSEALDVIWLDWADFLAKAADATEASATLVEVVADGGDQGATLQGYATLGNACSACHERFRLKRDD